MGKYDFKEATREDGTELRLLGIITILLEKNIITEQEYKNKMNQIIQGMKERGMSETYLKELRIMLNV